MTRMLSDDRSYGVVCAPDDFLTLAGAYVWNKEKQDE